MTDKDPVEHISEPEFIDVSVTSQRGSNDPYYDGNSLEFPFLTVFAPERNLDIPLTLPQCARTTTATWGTQYKGSSVWIYGPTI